jgi:hypothetical protein
MNYGELKQAIADTSQRSDLVPTIPSFVRMAHAKIMSQLQPPDTLVFETMDSGTVTNLFSNVWSLPLPVGCFEVRYVYINSLPIRSWSEDELTRWFASGQDAPAAGYAVQGLNLILAPGTSDAILISYKKRLPDFVDDTDTNWLLTYYPDVYLYGSLIHLNEYIQDMDQLSACDNLTSAQMAAAQTQIDTLKHGGQPRIRGA